MVLTLRDVFSERRGMPVLQQGGIEITQEVIICFAIWGIIDVARRFLKWMLKPMADPQEI